MTKAKYKSISCRHKKGLIMARADLVTFAPDQEPCISGVIECSGLSEIQLDYILLWYCPKCKKINAIDIDPGAKIYTEPCSDDNGCNRRGE